MLLRFFQESSNTFWELWGLSKLVRNTDHDNARLLSARGCRGLRCGCGSSCNRDRHGLWRGLDAVHCRASSVLL